MLRETARTANNNVWKIFEKWSHNRHFLHPNVQHFENALAGVGEGSEDLCGLPGQLPA